MRTIVIAARMRRADHRGVHSHCRSSLQPAHSYIRPFGRSTGREGQQLRYQRAAASLSAGLERAIKKEPGDNSDLCATARAARCCCRDHPAGLLTNWFQYALSLEATVVVAVTVLAVCVVGWVSSC